MLHRHKPKWHLMEIWFCKCHRKPMYVKQGGLYNEHQRRGYRLLLTCSGKQHHETQRTVYLLWRWCRQRSPSRCHRNRSVNDFFLVRFLTIVSRRLEFSRLEPWSHRLSLLLYLDVYSGLGHGLGHGLGLENLGIHCSIFVVKLK